MYEFVLDDDELQFLRSFYKAERLLVEKPEYDFLMDVRAKFRLASSYRLRLRNNILTSMRDSLSLTFSDWTGLHTLSRIIIGKHETVFHCQDGKITVAVVTKDHDIYLPSLHLLRNLEKLNLVFSRSLGKIDVHPLPAGLDLSIKLDCEMDFDLSGFGYVERLRVFLSSQKVHLSSFPDSNILEVEGRGVFVVDDAGRKVRELSIDGVDLFLESSLPYLERLVLVNSCLHVSSGLSFSSLSVLELDFSSVRQWLDMVSELFNSCRAREVNIVGLEDYGFLAGQTGLNVLSIANGHLSSIPDFFSEFERLYRLTIKSCGLERLNLPLFSNLKELDVSGNLLETIDDVCALQELKSLNVSGNRILVLPECLSSLKYLQELDVSSNPVEFLPDCFYNMRSLKYLFIRQTGITAIPKSFWQLRNLLYIYTDAENLDCPQSLQHKLRK